MEQALARRPGLVARLFTAEERRYCESKRDSAQHFAVRFAAKEAVAKALGKSLRWQEVEIRRAAGGAPRAVLQGKAGVIAAGGRMEISLSHSGEYAIACALYEEPVVG
jgi:holo-[acyl-carrier protein] synthase